MNMMNNVIDLMKMDPQLTSCVNGNLNTFKNNHDPCTNDPSLQNTSTMVTTPSLENLMNSRNLSNQLLSNSSLPLGAQIFTIPASLATFPNSDLIPVFINSLGQMVLANTGNLLANSLASLATTLTSLQQLSANRDVCLFGNNNSIPPNHGILDHITQQYQQIQMMKNSLLPQNWSNPPFQQPQRNVSPNYLIQPIQPPESTHVHQESTDKTIPTSLFSMVSRCNSNSLVSANIASNEFRFTDNKSPSIRSSVSSRSLGNKINQMIDVSNDYILGQDDHLVKEKAAEIMRQSYSHQTFNNNNLNESNQYLGTIGLNQLRNLDKSADHANNSIQNNQNMTVDGVDIGVIREFARNFKIKRLNMGLTQTQVGQALTAAEGPAYSQSAICRFEKLDITPKSAQKIKPILEKWITESEEKYRNGDNSIEEGSGSDINKKRKRRTSFTPQALEILNVHFEKKSHPTGSEMRILANELNYDREVIRVWFCNKRQALKNTIKRVKQNPGSDNNEPLTYITEQNVSQICYINNNSLILNQEKESITRINYLEHKSEAEDLSVEKKNNEMTLTERVTTFQTETAF